MSKERLEEVKHFVDLINFIPRDSRGMGEMDVVNVQEDMQWLIEQAERVQELEEEVGRLNGALHYQLSQENIRNEENRKLRKQNKRYREALEFYAKEYGAYRAIRALGGEE